MSSGSACWDTQDPFLGLLIHSAVQPRQATLTTCLINPLLSMSSQL